MPLYNPSTASLTVEEEDGTPSVAGVTKIQVTNGKLTNDSGTIVSLDLSTGVASSVTFAGAKAYNSTTQSVSNATATILTLDSEEYDSDALHDTVTNTSRMTVPTGKAGKYLVVGTSTHNGAIGSNSVIRLKKNGTTLLVGSQAYFPKTSASAQAIATVSLIATDYIEIEVYQDTGGAINFGHATADEIRTSLTMTLVGT